MEQQIAKNQILNLAQQFIDALHSLEEAGDIDAEPIAMLFSENAALTNAALELSGKKLEGRDAILAFWVQYKNELGNARSHFHHVTTTDRAAGLFWTTEGVETDESDEASSRYHGASLLEFDETGLITFFRGYYDTRELGVKTPRD